MKAHDSELAQNDIVNKLTKPIEHINSLIDILSKEYPARKLEKKKNITIIRNNHRQCLVMFSGSIALYRCSDGFIINAEAAPFIFGINTQLRYEQHLSLRAQETSEIALVPQQELYEIVEKNNLWESVARITDYSAAKIYTHCLAVSKLSAYEIIRHQLMTLMTEPEEIRQKMTAANYILSRSFLSRSGTMKILSYLKQAGFIDLRRGILMEISELPEKLNNYYMK